MLVNTNLKKDSKTQYKVSPRAVDEVLKSIKVDTKRTHSKSFFISLKNRKKSVSYATKTA